MAEKAKKRRRAVLLPILLAGVVMALLCLQLIRLNTQISDARTREAQLSAQVSAVTAKNEALQKDIDNAQDEELIKEIARNELGLVEPGEKVFHDVSNGN